MERIGQIAVFIICAQTVLHFRAKESYEKYMKLLVSMMLLLLMLEPVMELLGGGNKTNILGERIAVYEEELTDVLGRSALSSAQIEEILSGITEQVMEEQELNGEDMQTQLLVIQEAEENEKEIEIEEIDGVEVNVTYGDDTKAP